ncbi:MAG: hypothetical protein ACI9ME_001638, partial [Ilumatobacter sp.]
MPFDGSKQCLQSIAHHGGFFKTLLRRQCSHFVVEPVDDDCRISGHGAPRYFDCAGVLGRIGGARTRATCNTELGSAARRRIVGCNVVST